MFRGYRANLYFSVNRIQHAPTPIFLNTVHTPKSAFLQRLKFL